MTPIRTRLRLPAVIGSHVIVSAAIAAAFAWRFGHNSRAVGSHTLLLAEWDLALVAVMSVLVVFSSGQRADSWRLPYRFLVAITLTLQVYLYALDVVSNLSWGRNMTGHLVAAFLPTVWSGKEPFPVGAVGISVFACGTFAMMTAIVWWWRRALDDSVRPWLPHPSGMPRHLLTSTAEPMKQVFPGRGDVYAPRSGAKPTTLLAKRSLDGLRRSFASRRFHRLRVVAAGGALVALCGATLNWGIAGRDELLWKDELIASFFRPQGVAFEPTARRHAVAARDAALRAAYPPQMSTAGRKHVILIIIDSLRADRMQVYGYERPTTPFLSQLVQSGRMKRVDAAFATCPESLCGITSTLAGREFRDISAHTFQLQDVLRDQGYQTWFLLSGNHSAWNGLPQFYRASAGTLFDGSQTRRYTMDDDRLVLEGLERVPPALLGQPAFFYVHLMSPHYLGVQFPESHVFTRSDDTVSPGLEPYKILAKLNKPDRYDDRVLQADGIIRQLFDALGAKHYLDDAMVVVTGDHGEGLGERHWAHGWDLYNEDIRIPMLLYDAPATSYPDLAFATQVDIAPTILDRIGLPIPASWVGQSLLAPTSRRFTYHQTYFLPNRFAVLYRDEGALFKFIATPQYGQEELYDLTRDRGETTNLVAAKPELAALLREKVRAYRFDEP